MNISMLHKILLFLVITILLLTACSPHPGAGTWQAEKDNAYGIEQISVHYEGKAEFSTTKPKQADWHCFWGAIGKNSAVFQCTPSTNPEKEENYTLSVDENGIAEFSRNGNAIGRFSKVASP